MQMNRKASKLGGVQRIGTHIKFFSNENSAIKRLIHYRSFIGDRRFHTYKNKHVKWNLISSGWAPRDVTSVCW